MSSTVRGCCALGVFFMTLALRPSAAAPVTWNTNSSGNWNVAGNWTPGLPTASDDVTINRPAGSPVVSLVGSDNIFVRSVANAETLVTAGGNLTLTNGVSTSTGAFTHNGISGDSGALTVNGAGTTFTATGTVSLGGGGLATNSGGVITMTAATAFSGSGAFGTNVVASGSGSAIDLNNVTSWSGATGGNTINVQTFSGGFIDLDSVATISVGSTRMEANGAGSIIDLTALTSFSRTPASNATSYLWANGGTIQTPNLTALDHTDLVVSSTGTIDTADINSVTGSSIIADNNGDITFPVLTTYNGSAVSSPNVRATNPGSTVDLNNVTTWNGGTGGNTINVQATLGGSVDLDSIATLSGGSTRFEASGAGSIIDLTALTSFTRTTASNATSYLWANGGTIQTPNLTTLNHADLFVSSTGSIDTADINSVTGSSIIADNNGDIAFPVLTTYSGSTVSSPNVRSTNTGSTLDLSNVTTWNGSTGGNTINVQATLGGFLDLDSAATISVGSTRFEASGAGSIIDLTALTNFSRTASGNAASWLYANGGTIQTPNLTTVSNVGLYVDGAGTIDTADINSASGVDVIAENNGDIAFPALTTYAGPSSFSLTNRATGTGSTVDMNNVTNWSGGTGGQTVNVEATSGGLYDLDSLATISSGSTRFETQGAGSVIELTALTNFSRTASGNPTSWLYAHGAGTIQTPSLTTVANIGLYVDGTGTIDTADINSATGVDVVAENNGDISFPSLTMYTGPTGFSLTNRATGAGSTVDMNNVTNWSGGVGGQTAVVQATGGGFFDLDSVATISVGSTRFEAQSAGSIIELTALTNFSRAPSGNASSYLWANGGTIQTPNLTTINEIYLQVDGAGTIDTADITNANGSSFYTRNSGQLTMPALVTYTGSSIQTADVNPSGAGTQITFPVLTTLTGGGGGNAVQIQAQNGGKVMMNSVTSIPSGRVLVFADGASSVVNMTALATFNSSTASSTIRALNGGVINLKPTATTTATNVQVDLTSTGTINVGTLVMQSGSQLTGVGTLTGNLNNAAGEIRPNSGGTGIQTIQGSLTQGAAGSYEVLLTGTTPGTQFDQVNATGSATLAGTVNLIRSGAFTPAFGSTYRILTASSVSQYFTGLTNYNNTGTAHWLFATFYSPTAVDVKVVLGGDANGDGIVSGADYTIFADHYNALGGGYANGDFNSDGIVSGADYTIWADNYNAMAPPPSMPVPEPAGWALASAALAAMSLFARRMRRSS